MPKPSINGLDRYFTTLSATVPGVVISELFAMTVFIHIMLLPWTKFPNIVVSSAERLSVLFARTIAARQSSPSICSKNLSTLSGSVN